MPSPALNNWPDLPYDPQMEPFVRKLLRSPIRQSVEDGPPLARVQSQSIIIRVPMALKFSSAQHDTFNTFHIVTLEQGTLHFNMQVMLVGRTLVTRRCFFLEDPEIATHGLDWIVSFPLGVFYNASS